MNANSLQLNEFIDFIHKYKITLATWNNFSKPVLLNQQQSTHNFIPIAFGGLIWCCLKDSLMKLACLMVVNEDEQGELMEFL